MVTVEVILLSAHGETVGYRLRTRPCRSDEHPDAAARDLSELDSELDSELEQVDPGRLIHSTSWRAEAGNVILTYVALPDPHPHRATGHVTGDLAYSADPLTPSPPSLTTAHVASHACRHLAYLRDTDPLVAATAGAHPHLWRLISALTPAMAGALSA